ncbi:MAG: L,D-transpeptidase family protein [Gammaproteobacteria bacterium]|nr:L,D-transpeptidase family protein [Gammaproteobacteria bacterium]
MRCTTYLIMAVLICIPLNLSPLQAAATFPAAAPAAAESLTEDPVASDPVTEFLRHRLETLGSPGELEAGGEILLATELLLELYEARAYTTLWLQDRQPVQAALALPEAIRNARNEGLRPEDYHLEALERALTRVMSADGEFEARLFVDLELLATDAFLTLARHFADGKVDPLAIDTRWFVPATDTSLLPHLDAALTAENVSVQAALDDLLPTHPAYAALRERLALQRALRDTESWTIVDAGPALRRGDSGVRVNALARRLAELGDIETAWAEGDRFDAVIEAGVLRFQRRHGLEADGVVGAQTLGALNVSPAARINQLKVNMERWRWLPRDLGPEYVLVNIASFQMSVHADSEEVLRQPVVVGRPFRMTPVFSHRMTYLVLNPSWEVPTRLAAQDQLPLIRRDAGYLEQMGFTVLRGWGANETEVDPSTVDWMAVNPRAFPFRLRQRPGPLNALGQVKFMFPNAHNVYLHDTPARGAFAAADRALSSGCIRLSDPMALVDWLLVQRGPTATLSPERISSILESGQETTVRLRRPMPVHLLYWTAWVEDDQQVHYTRDVYQRDGAVLDALLGTAPAASAPETSLL